MYIDIEYAEKRPFLMTELEEIKERLEKSDEL